MTSRVLNSEAETAELGREIAQTLRPGDCVLLYGEMGAGKSVLARGIARALGVSDNMPSPSFVMLLQYAGRVRVNHFDLYRLSDYEEATLAGLDEEISSDAISIIEWPDILPEKPPRGVIVRLSRGAGERERVAQIEPFGGEE